MHSEGESNPETGAEPIPYQTWINPQWSPHPASRQILSWERYATDPEHFVLISCYESIRVAGWYRKREDSEFHFASNRSMDKWHARAMQALTPCLDGCPPHSRVLHPAFTITYHAHQEYWRGRVPFRLRGFHFDEQPVLDVRSDLRDQIESVIYDIWRSRAEAGYSSGPVDIVGFIRFDKDKLLIADRAGETLAELLADTLDKPQAIIEQPSGRDALVRLYRLDRLPRQIDLSTTTMVLVSASQVVGSGGGMEARDPSLPSHGDNIMSRSLTKLVATSNHTWWLTVVASLLLLIFLASFGDRSEPNTFTYIVLIAVGLLAILHVASLTILVGSVEQPSEDGHDHR